MKNQKITKIPQSAFSEMIKAFRHFDKVDEGCGYERLNAVMRLIQMNHQLTDDEIGLVENWAYKVYYKSPNQ